jgi:hypothetical protein
VQEKTLPHDKSFNCFHAISTLPALALKGWPKIDPHQGIDG